MKVSVKVVPVGGKSFSQNVEVEASGASVRDVCESAGVDVVNKDFTVNGKPATLDTHVSPNADVSVSEVAVSERPRGS